MTWKITAEKDEKISFIGDHLSGEYAFRELCERYDISHQTGYNLVNRYKLEGGEAFIERSHARHHHPNETSNEIKQHLINLKYRYPNWGPKKIKAWLEKQTDQKYPASSTIGDILKKQGLVKRRRYRKKVPPHTQPFIKCEGPNQVWSADFKGQFRLGNGKNCYPLTIFDNYSRYLLLCESLVHPNHLLSIKCFEKAFLEYGLPEVIKTDNGQPFAGTGIGGLTRLGIWLVKLGIMLERIEPGHPEQNGRHERMHRTLKEATQTQPKQTHAQQQRTFDEFCQEYNQERSHEGIENKRPAEVYTKSVRMMPAVLPEINYPEDYGVRKVKMNGNIKWHGKQFYVSELLHGEPIGLETIDEDRAFVYFSKMKLGIIDARKEKIMRPY